MKSPRQKEALERLRGETPEVSPIKFADVHWQKLMRAVGDALAFPNVTVSATIAELQGIFDRLTPGENCNGWVNPYPKDDPRNLLKQYQFTSFEDAHQFILDVWSRQTGKDFTVALRAGTDAYSKAGSQWTIAAPSERQSLESLEKVKTIIEAFGDIVADFQTEREHPEALIKSSIIILPNGSRIRAVPGMPHTVRGLTTNVAITEADFLEKPKETMRALLGSIANEEAGKKNIRLITTPNGKNGYTYGIWNKADSIYSKRLITIWHAVCMGLKQNPRLLEKALDDPEGWAQEFLCEWLDSSAVLLTYELIQSCESFEASLTDTPEMLAQSPLRKIGGIDFGRVNDPTIFAGSLRGMGMSILRSLVELKGVSTPDQMRILHPYMAQCDVVAIDNTGPGIGFCDLAVEAFGLYDPDHHEFGKIMPCTFTVPFKRLIFPRLRKSFETRHILIPPSIELREDLHAMAQIISNGQYNYKAPRTDEGHSDRCTALALMEHAAEQAGSAVAGFGTLPKPGPLEAMRNAVANLFSRDRGAERGRMS